MSEYTREQKIAEAKEHFEGTGGVLLGEKTVRIGRNLLSELQTMQNAMKGATIIANQTGAEMKQLREERDKLIEALKYAHRIAKRDNLYDAPYVEQTLKGCESR